MRYFVGALVLILGLVLTFFAAREVFLQHHAITTFVPTPAVVDFTDLAVHRGRKSTSYEVTIRYHYSVGNVPYNSDRIHPFEANDETSDSAHALLNHYPVGSKVTAYVDPADPSQSFLVHEYTFQPYLLTFGALGICGLGVGVLAGLFWRRRNQMLAYPLDDSGWQLLLPCRTVRAQFRGTLLVLLTFPLPATVLMLQYWFADPLAHAGKIALAVADGLILLGISIETWRRWSLSRHVSDARVKVRPVPLVRGGSLEIEAELDAFTPLNVEEMRAKIVCLEHYKERSGGKTRSGVRERGSEQTILLTNADIKSGDVVTGHAQITIPSHLPPTTNLEAGKHYPYYTWELQLQLKLAHAVDYKAQFPIEAV